MINKTILLFLFLISSFNTIACGTPDNWMDAFEKVKSENQWRDSMNELESLTMLLSCGGPFIPTPVQEKRFEAILKNALKNKLKIALQRPTHLETKSNLSLYQGIPGLDNLLESIYIKFKCLPHIPNKYFTPNPCERTNLKDAVIKAPKGANLRISENGKSFLVLKDKTQIRILFQNKDWVKIINPITHNPILPRVGYIHKSLIINIK